MALKVFENRVWGKDKRIDVNRLLQDILIYGLFLLLFILLVLIATGTLEGTRYAAIAVGAIIIIRQVLKMFEKHDDSQVFKWFWKNETVLIELAVKIWALIMKLAGSLKQLKKSKKE